MGISFMHIIPVLHRKTIRTNNLQGTILQQKQAQREQAVDQLMVDYLVNLNFEAKKYV